MFHSENDDILRQLREFSQDATNRDGEDYARRAREQNAAFYRRLDEIYVQSRRQEGAQSPRDESIDQYLLKVDQYLIHRGLNNRNLLGQQLSMPTHADVSPINKGPLSIRSFGRICRYEHGAVYFRLGDDRTTYIWGAYNKLHTKFGGTGGPLGFPLPVEQGHIPGEVVGLSQYGTGLHHMEFEGGTIYADNTGYYSAVWGDINNEYRAQGSWHGKFGFPIPSSPLNHVEFDDFPNSTPKGSSLRGTVPFENGFTINFDKKITIQPS